MHENFTIKTTGEYREWLRTLQQDERDAVGQKVAMLAEYGHQLRRPHSDTLKGSRITNLKELRAKTGQAVLRVAYVMDPSRSALLLIGGNKAGVNEKWFYKQLIAKAEVIYYDYL